MLECDDAGNVMLIDGVQRTWLYTIAGGWNLRHGQAGHTPLPGAGYYMSTQAGCLCFVPTTDEFIYLGGATYAYKISTDDSVTVCRLGGATAFTPVWFGILTGRLSELRGGTWLRLRSS